MILVKNTKIVDGSGKPMRQGDVMIVDGMISAIGNFPGRKAETVIDGLGMHLVPGIVDTNADIDRTLSLLSSPGQKTLRNRGVTTAIGGRKGASLAPLMYGSLATVGKWADTSHAHVDWHSMKEFRKSAERLPLGINFGTLAGYATIRRDIMGGKRGDLTEKERAVAMAIAEDAMKDGAFGISIDLASAYGQTIPYAEALAMAHAAAKRRRIITLGLRGGKTPVEGAQEAIALYRASGATVIIDGLVPDAPNKSAEKDCLVAAEAIGQAGDGIFFDVRIAPRALVPLMELLPRTAREAGIPGMLRIIGNPVERKRIGVQMIREPAAMIAHAPRELGSLIGSTLESFAKNRGLALKDAIFELMRITKMRASLLVPHAASELHAALMDHPRALVSGETSALFALSESLRWPIEKAVMRFSATPPLVFGIKKRGMIKENWHADIALMDPRYAMASVVVNGKITRGGAFVTP